MSSTTSKVAFDMARKYELSKEKVIIMGVCSLVVSFKILLFTFHFGNYRTKKISNIKYI